MNSSVVEEARANGVAADYFSVEHLGPKVERRAMSGGLVSVLAQGSQLVLVLAYTAVMARLLSPRDFGLVAISMAVAGLLNVFKDAGLSTATVQREDITHAQVSNLFWINLGVSGLAGLAMALAAPFIAWTFHQPPLVGISVVLASSFLFEGLAGQHMALLNRQMHFKTISAIELGSVAGGFLVGIALALFGFGYWSLAVGTVATAALRAIALWAVLRWRPQRPTRQEGTLPLVRFGAHLTLVGVIYSVARTSDTLLIGRFLGSEAAGLYSRATALLSRPLERFISTVHYVIVPALSRLQTDPARYREAFLQVFEGLVIVGFIFTGLFLPLAYPVVTVMFGQGWEGVAPIFAALTVAAIYLPASTSSSWLFTSQGRGRELLLTSSICACLMVASFIAGLRFGSTGVAISYSLSAVLIHLPITFHLAGRRGPVSTRDLWRAFVRHFPVCVVVLVGTSLAALLTTQLSPLTQLLLGVTGGLVAGAGGVLVFPQTRHAATRIVRALNDLRTPEDPHPSRLAQSPRRTATAEP